MLIVSAFYKYVELASPEEFKIEFLNFSNSIGLRGRTLLATEGINGVVSGTKEQILEFQTWLRMDSRFRDIDFKDDECLMHPFNKSVVKIKPELVRFEQNVSYKDAGKHISPEEFLELAKNEDSVIFDARNNYESHVGKFKGAITPNLETFREFPNVLVDLKGKEDKNILMYCTGGIRCEKASAYLKQQGFKKVYQLKGGILNFGKKCPDTIWEGVCFVFDKRLTSDVNVDHKKPITSCEICKVSCDLYRNCSNLKCNKLSVICLECEKSYGGSCSQNCFKQILTVGNI